MATKMVERPAQPAGKSYETRLKPLGDRVLVRLDRAPAESAGGILLPDQAQLPSREGTVLAVGPGRVAEGAVGPDALVPRVPVAVKPGDRVLCHAYAGDYPDRDDKTLILVTEENVFGVLGD